MGKQETHEILADTAARLFYAQGITASGVDTIVRESGISKPTLYKHYRSKAELVSAALARQHECRRQQIEAYLERRRHKPPEERLLSVFDWLARWSRTHGSRGCPFLNAAVELVGPDDESGREVVRAHKRWWQDLLTDLAGAAGIPDPGRLAYRFLLLLDGANARIVATDDARAVCEARSIASLLLAEAQRDTVRAPNRPGPRVGH